MVQEVVLLNLIEYTTSDLEERRMRIAEIYACVLLYFLLKAVALDVSSELSKWR